MTLLTILSQILIVGNREIDQDMRDSTAHVFKIVLSTYQEVTHSYLYLYFYHSIFVLNISLVLFWVTS